MKKKRVSIILMLFIMLATVFTFEIGAAATDVTNVAYINALGVEQTPVAATVVANDDTTWGDDGNDGWYVVNSNVTVDHTVTATGNINLILCNGCTLTVNGGTSAAISVGGENCSLTVYAQSKSEGTMGSLSATGSDGITALAAGESENATITVNGGRISAVGTGDDGCGIHASSLHGEASVTVNGGRLIAAGGGKSINAGLITAGEDMLAAAGADAANAALLAKTASYPSLSSVKYALISPAVCYIDANTADGAFDKENGDVAYPTVQSAINAVTGNTAAAIVMVADAEENVTVASGKTVTLDLNGHVLKGDGTGSVITNKGTLTITDSDADAKHKFKYSVTDAWTQDTAASGGISVSAITDKTADGTAIEVSGGCITGGCKMNQNGGGIYNTGKLCLYGGNIIGNTAAGNGGGVYQNGSMTVGGTAKIIGNTANNAVSNLYLSDGKTVTVSTDTPLASGASIGVTTADKPSGTGTVAITGSNSTDCHSYFVSDNAAYVVIDAVSESSHRVKLATHVHSWTYGLGKTTTENDTVTATCSGAGTHSGTNPETLTIVSPLHKKLGDGKEAKATLSGTTLGDLTVSAGDITYVGTGSTSYEENTTAPIAAGTYRASITVGGKTAYVEYTIAKVDSVLTNKPTGKADLLYSGSEQELANAGSGVTGGTLYYAVGDTEPTTGWTTSVPKATNAGDYKVWYKVVGDADHADTFPASFSVSIGKAMLTVIGADVSDKTYDGTKTATVTAVSFSGLKNDETLTLGTDYTASAEFDKTDAAGTNAASKVTVTVTLNHTALANSYEFEPVRIAIDDVSNYASLSFESNIGINFALALDKYADVAKVEITYVDPTRELDRLVTKTYTGENLKANPTTVDGVSGYYQFKVSAAAGQMSKDVTVKIYDSGNNVLLSETTSIMKLAKSYYDDYQNATDAKLAKLPVLAQAMVTYGGYAQKYFNVAVNKLAYSEIGAADLTEVPDLGTCDTDVVCADDGGLCYYAQTFSCRPNTRLRFALLLQDVGMTGEDYTATFTTQPSTQMTVSLSKSGSYLIVNAEGIPATKLDDTFVIRITRNSDNEEVATITSSALCYAQIILGSGSYDTNLKNMVKAIYLYNRAAEDYFNKISETREIAKTIGKATQTIAAPTVANQTKTSVTLAAQSGQGATKYGYNTENTAPTEWQESTEFTGLSSGKTYYFFAMYEGNDNYEAAVSSGRAVTTLRSTSTAVLRDVIVTDAENGSVSADKETTTAGTVVTVSVEADEGYQLESLVVIDTDGKELYTLTAVKEGETYKFYMPSDDVTVTAVFAPVNSFVDVKESAYYYDAVLWAKEKGITDGVDETHFDPTGITTRAQMVTFLWRAVGCPEPKSDTCAFTDISKDKYYYKAVLWAASEGITNGVTETTFAPRKAVKRAQVVTFLWRYAKAGNVTAENPFVDVKESAYYYDAVLWAKEEGITGGMDESHFAPIKRCIRAQIVSFLYRFFHE